MYYVLYIIYYVLYIIYYIFQARQATDQYCDDLKIQNHGISTILNATATVTSTSTKRYLGRGGGGEEMEDEQNLR